MYTCIYIYIYICLHIVCFTASPDQRPPASLGLTNVRVPYASKKPKSPLDPFVKAQQPKQNLSPKQTTQFLKPKKPFS